MEVLSALMDQFLLPLNRFMAQGGPVLWWLAFFVCLSWILALERLIYILIYYPRQSHLWKQSWLSRADQTSWYARSVREGWLGEAHNALYQHMNLIKVFVTICPMLGLLGTVTGMISVFDVMATQGSSNPKLMASGISLATLPTMAGMVAALIGLFIHSRLLKKCQMLELNLEKSLRSHT